MTFVSTCLVTCLYVIMILQRAEPAGRLIKYNFIYLILKFFCVPPKFYRKLPIDHCHKLCNLKIRNANWECQRNAFVSAGRKRFFGTTDGGTERLYSVLSAVSKSLSVLYICFLYGTFCLLSSVYLLCQCYYCFFNFCCFKILTLNATVLCRERESNVNLTKRLPDVH